MRSTSIRILSVTALASILVTALLVGCGDEDPEAARGTSGSTSTVVTSTSSAGTSTSSTGATTSQAPAAVTLDEVRYGCGPTDATGIAFTAVSDAPVRGHAELVIGDEVFGATEEITVDATPVHLWMDISLDQEAYDTGEGEVRFRALGSDQDLAVEPVTLRLEVGYGCG